MSEETRAGLPILHFADGPALERWLDSQPASSRGIWLKMAKKGHDVTSVTLAEAVDAGLCFGWIDGQLNKYDERWYLIRYTPRRPRSRWSEINVARAGTLLAEGRVRPGGLEQIEAAQRDGRWDAAYPPASRITVPEDLAAALRANPAAGERFERLKSADRYGVLHRLHHVTDPAKRPAALSKAIERLLSGAADRG